MFNVHVITCVNRVICPRAKKNVPKKSNTTNKSNPRHQETDKFSLNDFLKWCFFCVFFRKSASQRQEKLSWSPSLHNWMINIQEMINTFIVIV